MNDPRAIAFLCAAVLLVATPTTSRALTAASADDICAPTEDPCVIDEVVDVTGSLDFGLRSVHVTGGGRLNGQPDVSIDCGELIVDVGGGTQTAVIETDGADSGSFGVDARRACSGDAATPCFSDSVCSGLGLGTCSVGAGTIYIDGRVSGAGAFPGSGSLRAAGDIDVVRKFNFSSNAPGHDGGYVDIDSSMGSVRAAGELSAKSGEGGTYYYQEGLGGSVTVRAAVDVQLDGGVNAWGRGHGGEVTIQADRDVIITSGIEGSAGGGAWAFGGNISVDAGRDLIVTQIEGGAALQDIGADGGGYFYFYGYYGNSGDWFSGYGGYQYLHSAGAMSLGKSMRMHANGGPSEVGGQICLTADGGPMTIDGQVRAQGTVPPGGPTQHIGGGVIEIIAPAGLTVGTSGIIETSSNNDGGEIRIEVGGPSRIDGLVDVRAKVGETSGAYNYTYGYGGTLTLSGETDLVVGGSIRGGGKDGGDNMTLDVCRLTVEKGGLIDNARGEPEPSNADVVISVQESMRVESQGKIKADAVGGSNLIEYRDPNKPPVIVGDVDPAPVLSVNPGMAGCPVCGNGEIDAGESCDDGNTTSGDGCRDDCQDEGCIAESPGFPGTPLCDDGQNCTADSCDPVAHTCVNVVSCDEGVACTVDACVLDACEHTPDDALCEDHNDCTDDLCNEVTGCVHAALTDVACEDGDFCTVTGACDAGNCRVTGAVFTVDNRVKVKMRSGVADDKMSIKTSLPLADFTSAPTLTGATLVVVDALDQEIYRAEMRASDWVAKGSNGDKFSFKDTLGPASAANGLSRAKITPKLKHGVAKTKFKMKGGDIPGAEGQGRLSVSVLFGADPAVDECLTGRFIPCKTKPGSNSCKDD